MANCYKKNQPTTRNMETQTPKNKKIALDYWKSLWETRNLNKVRDHLADNVSYHAPRMEMHGKQNYLELVQSYLSVFEDTHLIFEDQIAEGDKVVTRVTFSGIFKGAFGDIQPTGEKVTFKLINILQFLNGRIINEWEVYDELGLMQQIGMELVHKEHTH